MEPENIIHFDATARRREKMQQTARSSSSASQSAATTRPATNGDDSQNAEPNRAEPNRAEPNRAEPSRVSHADAEPNGNTARPAADSQASATSAAPEPPQQTVVKPSIAEADLESFLINFVVEQTGYPAEIVELDADLEADLGIDSIKKAQMFGELREHFDFAVDSSDSLSLDDFPTLRHIVGFLKQAIDGCEPTADQEGETQRVTGPLAETDARFADDCCDAEPVTIHVAGVVNAASECEASFNETLSDEAPSDEALSDEALSDEALSDEAPFGEAGRTEDLESFLVNFVVEQTGYPPELVELDADLEADLGIDSIKKAQMFGELREVFAFNVDAGDGLSLADFPTLRHILQFLNEHVVRERNVSEPNAETNTSGADAGKTKDQPRGLAWNGSRVATDASIVDSLRRILIEQGIADAARANLTRTTRLMDDVGLDSIGMLDLIQAVEKEFDISISLDDLDLRGLNSAATFAALIQRKLSGLA